MKKLIGKNNRFSIGIFGVALPLFAVDARKKDDVLLLIEMLITKLEIQPAIML